jgi:hypothetical protein
MTNGEYMFNGTRVGSTLDGVSIASASDDEINIHGYWGEPYNVSGKSIDMKFDGYLVAGDVAEFYSGSGSLVARCTLAKAPEGTKFTFNEEVPINAAKLKVRFPAVECDGWTIKNCTFMNNYQRILIQTGSGTFENNKIFNMGHTMSISNTYNYVEGGVLGDIVFRNNLFVNSSNSPELNLFSIAQNSEWNGVVLGGRIDISGNMFIGCGRVLWAKNMEGITVDNNTFIEPVVYGETVTSVSRLVSSVQHVNEYSFKNNALYSTLASDAVGENGNSGVRISKDLAERAAFYANNSQKGAKEIIEIIKENISKG